MSALKKYTKIFSIGFSDMLAWRFGFFMVAFSVVLSWIVMIIFWNAVYKDGNQIGAFTLDQLILYYTFNSVLLVIFDYTFIWDISTALHEGKLSEFLVKPISYINFKFVQEFGARAAALLGFALPLVAVVYYFRNIIPHDPIVWIWCIATAICGFLLVALFGLIASMTNVFFQSAHATNMVFFSLSFLLSGRMIPIDVMPVWLGTIARLSPFPLITGLPLEFILGTRTSLSLHEILLALAWFVVLLILAKYIWKFAAIKYEAGGI